MVPAYLNQGKTALAEGCLSVGAEAGAIAFLVSEVAPDAGITVAFEDGHSDAVPLGERGIAWKAWPKWFPAQIEIVPFQCRDGRIQSISVTGAKLWAVTLAANSEVLP